MLEAATRRKEVAAKHGSESFAVDQKVVIKQKAKERHGTMARLSPFVEVVSDGGEKLKYRVPYSTLVKEHLTAAAKVKGQPRQASAKPKARFAKINVGVAKLRNTSVLHC